MAIDNLGGTTTDTNTTVPSADTSGALDGFFSGTMQPRVHIVHSVSMETQEKMLIFKAMQK